MPSETENNNGVGCEYTIVEEDVLTALDPELQNAVLRARPKPDSDGTLESSDVYVDVIARLKDPTGAVPQGIEGVQRAKEVITGQVKIKDIVDVRTHENIYSLKGGRRIHEMLDNSVPEIGASRPQLRANFPGKVFDGSGVIVGIVDHDCDFAHPNFINERGSRILFLWDQNRRSETHRPPAGFEDGREFDKNAIDEALAFGTPECYKHLDYEPQGLHGTQVLDIAAGNGTDTNPAGVAPNADLIFVNVKDDDIQLEEPLGNSRNLFDAVKYIFDKVDEVGRNEGRPRSVVVNVSLNSNGGPHDGSTPFERGIDHLLQTPGRAVVIAAGNSAGDNAHIGGILRPGQAFDLPWQIKPEDKTDNKVEIWYGGTHEIKLSLISPGGQEIYFFELGTTKTILCSETPVARVFHRANDPNNHDNQILIVFDSDIESGIWHIVLRSLSESAFTFHAWIETDDQLKSRFLFTSGSDDSYTIGSLACGYSTIAVGGYFTTSPQIILSKSAEGPTRDGRLKPEVSAPGATSPPNPFSSGGIRAAKILTGNTIRSTGTSSAAPHVTGLIALLMQGAAPELLSIEKIRELVISGAHRDKPFNDSTWHPRFGIGRIDACRSLLCQAFPKHFTAAPATSEFGMAANISDQVTEPATNENTNSV
jgi:subtilisin family serine protease